MKNGFIACLLTYVEMKLYFKKRSDGLSRLRIKIKLIVIIR